VKVTDISYFIFRGRTGTTGWNVTYISNVTDGNAMQISTNGGTAWTNVLGTIDAHLHQYDGTDSLYYYACASDNSGNENVQMSVKT